MCTLTRFPNFPRSVLYIVCVVVFIVCRVLKFWALFSKWWWSNCVKNLKHLQRRVSGAAACGERAWMRCYLWWASGGCFCLHSQPQHEPASPGVQVQGRTSASSRPTSWHLDLSWPPQNQSLILPFNQESKSMKLNFLRDPWAASYKAK